MQVYEAKNLAMSVAVSLSVDGIATEKKQITAAIAYLCGKSDKQAFIKKCVKKPLYARAVLLAESNLSDFGVEKLCAAHKALFEPRTGSGEFRDGELMLTGGSCADPKLLRGSLKNVLSKLQEIQGAPAASKADFAAQLCCYIRELIILSPFAFGNGIVRRTFIQAFCRNRGFLLTYAASNKKEIAAAETVAFATDDPQPLFSLFMKTLNYRQEEAAATKSARLSAQRAVHALPARNTSKPVRTQEELKTDAEHTPNRASASENKPRPSEPSADRRETEKRKVTAQTLRQMRKTLDALTTQVNDLLKSLPDDE